VTRVAAVDLGTNATRLLVADVTDGRVDEVARRTRITRLGEGVDARRRLLPVPIARVRNVLGEYRREAEALGAERVLAVATSAVRDAENGEAFLGEVEWSYGFATLLLSGDEEAALTRRGVGPVPPGTLVLDVGGGSTELSVDAQSVSLDVGSVRLTERFLDTDPPQGDELEQASAHVRSLLPVWEASTALAVDGTVAELAALAESPEVTRAFVDAQLARLAAVSAEERRSTLRLEPDRADAIVAGVLIVSAVLAHFGLGSISHSGRDLLNGAVLAAAELPATAEGAAPPGAYTCC
jgi:exopolyphosphatase / guanosine-5'-triphosphate,3'-diphosphate pyrophosphatase